MDDFSVRRVIQSIAPLVPRHYVVREVKQNLIETDRKEMLKRFSLPHFKKTALVVMGEPSPEHKKKVQRRILLDKQAKAESDWKVRKAEKERAKQLAQRQ